MASNLAPHGTHPFRHYVERDVLDADDLRSVVEHLGQTPQTEFQRHPNGYEFANVTHPGILAALCGKSMRERLECAFGRRVGFSKAYPLPQFYRYTDVGERLAPHTDHSVGRDLVSIIYLSIWQPGDGGELVLHGDLPELAEAREIRPLQNTIVAFELSERSWHSVRPILRVPRTSVIIDWQFAENI